MHKYLVDQEVDSIDKRLIKTQNTLEKKAKEWIKGLECAPRDMHELNNALNKHFGKSKLKKLQEFNRLKQTLGQTLRSYYNLV